MSGNLELQNFRVVGLLIFWETLLGLWDFRKAFPRFYLKRIQAQLDAED